MKRLERIVVGTDFSDLAESAVDQAVELAELVGAAVTIVHAYELPMLSLPDGVVVSTAEVATGLTENAAKRLKASAERQKDSKVSIGTVLRMGAAWDELNAIAADEQADLIVVGTHGRRGVSRALIGSVAERVVRTATVPVLVLHAAPAKVIGLVQKGSVGAA
jgi:nucleotide-binding universal stress UspA family protein